MFRKPTLLSLFALGLSALAAGCDTGASSDVGQGVTPTHEGGLPSLGLPGYQYSPSGTGLNNSATGVGTVDRTLNYGLALRTASIKLRGDLPTMVEMRRLESAVKAGANDGSENDPQFVYSELVRSFIYDSANTVAFNRQMMQFWRNTLRMGGTLQGLISDLTNSTANMRTVNLETAPAFMARLVAEQKDMRTAFTSPTGNCPTFDATTGTFANGNCFTGAQVVGSATGTAMGNNVPENMQAGVLTNPGFMAQYYSNDGFRRTRLINELFACHRFPTEFASAPELVNGVVYSSPWPKMSISNSDTPPSYQTNRRVRPVGAVTTTANKDYVDFSLRGGCVNCHTTMNHRTPLFATFDQVGYYSGDPMKYMVVVPVTDSPFAQFQDFLPPNEKLAWKFGTNTATFQEFGKAMSDDPETAKCMMIRAWNHAYSRDDVVNDLALVPESVIEDMSKFFVQNNYNMKKALHKLYTDANFVRF